MDRSQLSTLVHVPSRADQRAALDRFAAEYELVCRKVSQGWCCSPTSIQIGADNGEYRSVVGIHMHERLTTLVNGVNPEHDARGGVKLVVSVKR